MLRSHKPDLVLLDLMLPKLGGLDVIKQLRVDDPDTPIIVLSAKDQEGDKVLALSLGADDYVTKPFSIVEVIARMRVALAAAAARQAAAAASRRRASATSSSTWPGGASSSTAARSSRRRASSICCVPAHAPGHGLLARAADAAGLGAEPLRHGAHGRQLRRAAARQDRGRSRRAASTSRRCAAWAIASTRDRLTMRPHVSVRAIEREGVTVLDARRATSTRRRPPGSRRRWSRSPTAARRASPSTWRKLTLIDSTGVGVLISLFKRARAARRRRALRRADRAAEGDLPPAPARSLARSASRRSTTRWPSSSARR